MTEGMTQPPVDPLPRRMRQFAIYAFLSFLDELEPQSRASIESDVMFSMAQGYAFGRFEDVGLTTRLLFGDEDTEPLSATWSRLRRVQPGSVSATKLWRAVQQQLADTPVGSPRRWGQPEVLTVEQAAELKRLVSQFEKNLRSRIKPGDVSAHVIVGRIGREQVNVLRPDGTFSDEVSPLYAALRSEQNPLPFWELGTGSHLYVVAVVPEVLSSPVMSWLDARGTFPADVPALWSGFPRILSKKEWEAHQIMLALMLPSQANRSTAEEYGLMDRLAVQVGSLLRS